MSKGAGEHAAFRTMCLSMCSKRSKYIGFQPDQALWLQHVKSVPWLGLKNLDNKSSGVSAGKVRSGQHRDAFRWGKTVVTRLAQRQWHENEKEETPGSFSHFLPGLRHSVLPSFLHCSNFSPMGSVRPRPTFLEAPADCAIKTWGLRPTNKQ